MPKKISLKQFLMKTGYFRNAEECVSAIRKKEVTLNGEAADNPNHYFNPKRYIVKFKNERLKPVKKMYFALNKPQGLICQKSKEEKSIYDLLESLKLPKPHTSSLFAVGRLDKDTEGLIVITNDGKLSDRLAKPERNISKKYLAELEKPITPEQISSMESGIEIIVDGKPYKTKPCAIKSIDGNKLEITIYEGKKRQIRKMLEAAGSSVALLTRIAIGGLELGDLKSGDFKELQREEIYKKLFDGPKENPTKFFF